MCWGTQHSHLNMSYILKIILFVMVFISVSTMECPAGCRCRTRHSISCSGLQAFPNLNLAGTTYTEINIYNSSLKQIPTKAFGVNSKLERIIIYLSSIGTIGNCAFSGLKAPRLITIYHSTIKTIESGAFSNLTFYPVATFNINNVNIDTIQSYAFTTIVKNKAFSIYNASITSIKSFAFHNFSVSTFSLYNASIAHIESDAFSNFTKVSTAEFHNCNVTMLHCNTINKFREVRNKININNLYLNCDCNIAWLLDSSINMQLSNSVVCSGPPTLVNRPLRDLNVTTVCPSGNYTKICPRQQALPPGPCPLPSTDGANLTPLTLWMLSFIGILITKTNLC